MGQMADMRAPLEPKTLTFGGGKAGMQEWVVPTDTAFLNEFLTYVFSTYWDQIVWGPLIDGASYELMCPCAPTKIDFDNGYLTVNFGGPHFHLCTGEIKAPKGKPPVPPEFNQRRRPSRATIWRQLDDDGAPCTWGFSMKNGAGEPMLSIFFSSPFVTAAETLEKQPKWERLAMWRDLSAKYLGRGPEAFDESGVGFTKIA